jgi:hypothetical protein
MLKYLYSDNNYCYLFTEEDRKKITDFFFEMTGLNNIKKITIEPQGMYIETISLEGDAKNA